LVVEVALAMGHVAAFAMAIVASAFNSGDPNYVYPSYKVMPESMPKGNHLEVFSTSSVHCLSSPPFPTNEPQKLDFIKVIDGAFTLVLS
jgi:hypothetical protein